MVFENWHHLIDCMLQGLKLESKLESKLTIDVYEKATGRSAWLLGFVMLRELLRKVKGQAYGASVSFR
jgi:hypothetical protein